MKTLENAGSYKELRSSWGQQKIGFVPTMGALHHGHAHLLKVARQNCEKVVLSIFVNPTQFGPNEDFSKYPRTLDNDLAIAKKEGVDAVFVPSVLEMYPDGFSTVVEESTFSKPLCGSFRPGHFRGVTTVVARLFGIVQPTAAFFGLKDLQQFLVIKKMCSDLASPIQIEGVPTFREPSGLAASSRNVYLSDSEKTLAPAIAQTLNKLAKTLQANHEDGVGDLGLKIPELPEVLEFIQNGHVGNYDVEIQSLLNNFITETEFKPQYISAFRLPLGWIKTPIAESNSIPTRAIAIAGFLGKTRLIDNVLF